jgi:hypothetical protein
MNTYVDKKQETSKPVAKGQNQAPGHVVSKETSTQAFPFQRIDNRPEAFIQRKLQDTANRSSRVVQLRAIQAFARDNVSEKDSRNTALETTNGHENSEVTQLQVADVVQLYDEDFEHIRSLVGSYSNNAYLIANVNNPGNFNQKLSELKGYKALEDADKLKVKTQVRLKIQHTNVNAVVPEDPIDIAKAFNSLKSCVITALMFAEGGTVLGTSSVEELHNILWVQFPKWRQYSDDGILAQMYAHFGYQTAQFGAKNRHSAVTDADRNRGMTSSTGDVGHMVGFRKAGQSYNFKDNDHGDGTILNHATRNDMVNKIWWK